ncbi:MAG: NAD(P)-dependent oxidoreductase [Phycisphaerales bacterium]|nr:NAD(P)-dependent oxidoreductase [Phycisphaerales bacterium]
MNIALTGVTGFIGQAAAQQMSDQGHHVTGLVRPGRKDAIDALELDHVIGTMADREAFEPLLDGADVLVHNAVDWEAVKAPELHRHLDVNLNAGMELLEAAAIKGCHIVLVSSVAVHHHMLERWQGNIDHMHPTRPGNRYGALKAALESHCWALHTTHGIDVSVLRPAAVYGMDPRRERTIGWPMIEAMLEGRQWDRRGGGKFVHVEDVASCMLEGAQRRGAGVQIHHLADCYARWSDWVEMARTLLGDETPTTHASAPRPANMFEVESVARGLGVALNRGHEGIRTHIEEMIRVQRGAP